MTADSASDEVGAAVAVALAGAKVFALSRVRTPRLDAMLPPGPHQILPVVWGATLWRSATVRCVVEQPNGLGLFEDGFPEDAVVVATLGGVRLGSEGREAPGRSNAARLRRRLLQVRGVLPATRRLDTSRFVVLFPCDPSEVCAVPPPAGIIAEPVGADLPEYAGGVRFEVDGEAVESDLVAYAALLATRVRETEGRT